MLKTKALTKPSKILPLVETIPSEVKLIAKELFREMCVKVGLSDENAVLAIKRAIEAKKGVYDSDGDLVREEDDTNAQLKGAMMYFQLLGYFNDSKSSTDMSTHNHVTYAWLTTPPSGAVIR